ncbi:MAG: DUF1674 domain-containing protein [Woeseia sp.]|nr:DUF1674 domain-containing protein [Woeseia sp.]
MSKQPETPPAEQRETALNEHDTPTNSDDKHEQPMEIGGREGPDPTRFGDWEKAGRCIDF